MTHTYFYDYRGTLEVQARDHDTADMHAAALLPEGAEWNCTGSEEFDEDEDHEPKDTH